MPFIFCSNYDHGLSLTYFMVKVKFCNLGFCVGNGDNDGFFGNYCIL